jgi:hypothetical protein
MPHIATGHERHYGREMGECVSFVRQVTGLPPTAQWRPGVKARGGGLAAGTAIATFVDGRYTSRKDGTAHAAILLAEQSDGLLVADCWVGQHVHQRVMRFRGGTNPTNAMNDGDCFHAIELAGNGGK